ncbi:MAG: hypothetical protein NTY38_00140, partial [Acidobacteria bacterium]|nr:hypothetical protein [Acidobacteriota bacterium]
MHDAGKSLGKGREPLVAPDLPFWAGGQIKGSIGCLKLETGTAGKIGSRAGQLAIGRIAGWERIRITRQLALEWIIIDPDGGIIDKMHFLDVIKSGALTHEKMESENARVRIYGDTAIVRALT